MTDHKRRSGSVDQGILTCGATKRHKTDVSIFTKERKEKVGEQIAALQQLVSPFGKTDTASVLLEAMEYIKFLQEQVKVLSAPYLRSTPAAKMQESELYSLRSRGLCLVPISCTLGVARSNGADIWAPIKASSPNLSPLAGPQLHGMHKTGLVRSIWQGDGWRSSLSPLPELDEAWAEIPTIEILPDKEDSIVWMFSSNGSFSAKSAWEGIRPRRPAAIWAKIF
ncbi:hypothetical protein HHK36_013242 [Tetracentron sinense]|uniref:BHLH domain-containing protein n=1 Tax=Tetracentron sinense TaxID=13715 RepID=A0A834Z8D3_TETSI|nr:hypothetical protein HHK36_013242 [Tetracentron sinense]